MSTSTILDRIRALLEKTPPFDRLTDDQRLELMPDISVVYYGPGEVVMQQGIAAHPGLYIVESGTVRLLDVTRQQLIGKVSEGETFGSFGLVKGGATIYEAKAVEPTVCALLKGERFQQLYSTHEEFAAYFDQDLRLYVRRMGSALDVTGSHLLFSRSLDQFGHRELVRCTPKTTAQEAAQLMRREGVGALLVVQGGQAIGLVTDSDLRDRVLARAQPANTPVRKIMSSPVLTVSTEVPIFEAMMTMLRHNVHRLVLTRPGADGQAEPVGMLTDRDVAHFRGQDPVATVHRIVRASSVQELAGIRQHSNEQLLNLYRQGTPPEMLYGIMTVFYDRLAIRVLELVERELRAARGAERVDLPWAWVRLGSGGRQEMALNSEQHNALIYANPTSDEEAVRAEQWFNRLAERANEALATCGFQMSEYVAGDARWRQPLRQWQQTYRSWIHQAEQSNLVPTPIFFDLRAVFGATELVDALKEDIIDALNVQAMDPNRTFLKLLAANALEHGPPSSFLRKMLDRLGDRQSFDVRESGVVPVADAARVFALEMRYLDTTNTFDRLRRAAEAFPDLAKVIEEALEAYQYLVDFRLESQLRAVESGDEPVNQIDAAALTRMQQRLLRNVFRRAASLQDALARHYDISRGWLS